MAASSTTTKFTATRGVSFDDLGVQFLYDADATKTTNGARADSGTDRIYSVELDAKQAAELKKLDANVLEQYGIAEAKAARPAKDD